MSDAASGPMRARGSDAAAGRDVTRPPLPEPLPAPVVDNHCHLDIADGDDWLDPGRALAMAASVGVPRIVQIGCDLPGARWAVETATAYDAIVAGVAIHPNEAPRLDDAGGLDTSAGRDRAVGHRPAPGSALWARPVWTTSAPGRTVSRRRSGRSPRTSTLALRLDKALVIHDRDAHDDILAMLDEHGVPGAHRAALLLR